MAAEPGGGVSMKNLGLMIAGIGAVLNGSQSTNSIMSVSGTCFIVLGVWMVAHEVFGGED